jgi:hypothetical protein
MSFHKISYSYSDFGKRAGHSAGRNKDHNDDKSRIAARHEEDTTKTSFSSFGLSQERSGQSYPDVSPPRSRNEQPRRGYHASDYRSVSPLSASRFERHRGSLFDHFRTIQKRLTLHRSHSDEHNTAQSQPRPHNGFKRDDHPTQGNSVSSLSRRGAVRYNDEHARYHRDRLRENRHGTETRSDDRRYENHQPSSNFRNGGVDSWDYY